MFRHLTFMAKNPFIELEARDDIRMDIAHERVVLMVKSKVPGSLFSL